MSVTEPVSPRRWPTRATMLVIAIAVLTTGCKERSKEATPQPSATTAVAGATSAPIVTSPVTRASWAPDALEELLAPIALYPDQLLMQILAASVNSQEVLDGGNWLLQNLSLRGDTLDAAATRAGFGAPMRALLQFPTVIDMLCQEIDWTRQLGSAVTSDQKSVLDAVQRLRAQAAKVGNLQSTPQQIVETKTENDKVIVEVKPANPEVVYVPQYNPQAVYTTPPPTPAPTQTTTVVQDDDTVSTETAVLGGLLAFGAGVLVGNAFDDDDDDCCYANWGSSTVIVGARPFYPAAYAYRPAYGTGFRPAYGYSPPAGYRNNYNRNVNNNININNNNNYYNRFNKDQNLRSGSVQSPLRGAQPLPAASSRAGTTLSSRGDVNTRGESWKGRSTYEGKPNAATNERLSQAAGTRLPPARRPDSARTIERAPTREAPARTQASPRPSIDRPAPERTPVDRGYDASGRQDRAGDFDQTRADTAPRRARDDAFSGARSRDSGSFERAASARGRASAGGMERREARAGGGSGRRRG